MLLIKIFTSALLAVSFVAAVPKVKVLDEKDFTLYGKPGHYEGLIKKLDKALPNVSVNKVIKDVNHINMDYTRKQRPGWNKAFSWSKRKDGSYNDQGTTKWYPQGITSSSDAYGKGTYGKNDIILASWYDHTTKKASNPKNKGVRISFIDNNKSKPAYRNVLLVVPYETKGGNISYHPVRIHAGGIMWYGDKLYVVDTDNGIRIFDLGHIYKVDNGKKIGHVGKGKYSAANYKYIIPQWGHYLAKSKTAKGFNFSFISLDRTTTPDSFIVGQYDKTGAKNRIARFDLDAKTRLPKATGNTAVATKFYKIGLKSMQGAVSVKQANGDLKYFFTVSKGDKPRAYGTLYTWIPGKGLRPHPKALSRGPEDLMYRKQTNSIYTLGEHPGDRPVYGINANKYN